MRSLNSEMGAVAQTPWVIGRRWHFVGKAQRGGWVLGLECVDLEKHLDRLQWACGNLADRLSHRGAVSSSEGRLGFG